MVQRPCAQNKRTVASFLRSEPEAAGDDLRIQFAQVTTCGNFEFQACFQVFVEGVQAPYQEWCMEGDGSGPELVPNPCETYAQTNAAIDKW